MKSASIKNILFPVIVIVAFAAHAIASSLADYQKRIESAELISKELVEIVANDDKEFEMEKIKELRGLVPNSEKIDLPAGSVETDNSWLATDLDQFAAEPNTGKRVATLTAISERLAAISGSAKELNSAISGERTKDQDKQKLADILQRPEYQKAQPKEESLFQRWWREFMEWLARVFPRAPISPGTASSFESLKLGLQILVFAIVIALVGFLVWRFVPFFSRRFRGRTRKEKHDRVILGERVGADESAADIFSEAERLAGEGDHRGAIRKGYIALLCELGDRKVVRLARHKTNRDYLSDVRKRDELFEDMTGLTGNFERSWYGLRLAQADDWEEFRERCHKAISAIKGF